MKKVIIILLVMASGYVLASTEPSPISNITDIYSYSEYGGGDVLIKLESNGTNCSDGYWLKNIDPGFQTNFSMLLAAYQAKAKVE